MFGVSAAAASTASFHNVVNLHSPISTIAESHSLHCDVRRLENYYRNWAGTYDNDVGAEKYIGPQVVASIVQSMHGEMSSSEKSNYRILDVGCGTGLVGRELAQKGFSNLDGCDLSPEMTAKAAATGVYANLRDAFDLNKPIDPRDVHTYDAIVCCGVFTLGTVAPSGLHQLLSLVKPGGTVTVSARKSYAETENFAAMVDQIVQDGKATVVVELKDAPYIREEGAYYWGLRIQARCSEETIATRE